MRQERQTKERLSREKDVLIAEKFNLEQMLAVSAHFLFDFFLCILCDSYLIRKLNR